MRVASLRLHGIRCFEDTGDLPLSPGCNIFVGMNNSGKSTLLKAITAWQCHPLFETKDARFSNVDAWHNIIFSDVKPGDLSPISGEMSAGFYYNARGGYSIANMGALIPWYIPQQGLFLRPDWPNNFIIPFAAKRQTVGFDQTVSRGAAATVTGTFHNLYARIDRVASPGMSAHSRYKDAIEAVVGVNIVAAPAETGKEAGYYFDDENFVALDRMGDGVAEMTALIVELSLAKGKLFVLEEPETNLHPSGLKALLQLIRESVKENQFVIATHSNVVVRELAGADTSIFRVYREGTEPSSPSQVELVAETPAAHRQLLRELGYEFGDFDLHEGWLFLEESSAETIIQAVLIPWFAPRLMGRLRTYSAAGVTNIEPSVSEFKRLVSFVHLEPVYRDRLWVRADGDLPGKTAVASLQKTFPYLKAPWADTFQQAQFERYYPARFQSEVSATLATSDQTARRKAKSALLQRVLEWTRANEADARVDWSVSAAEQIELLREISSTILLPAPGS